jgi:N-acylneuraminate cytidylyltransferase
MERIVLLAEETEVQDIDTEEDWKMAEMKYKLLYVR